MADALFESLPVLAARLFGKRWLCLGCGHEYVPRARILGGIEHPAVPVRDCPECGSLNVRTPIGRVRMAVRND